MVHLEKDNLDELVKEGLYVVDFYAEWCGPCKMLAPVLDKIVKENDIKLAKVDVDENEELIKRYRIMSVPTIKIFKNGEEVGTSVGVVSESRILELIK